MDDAWFHTLTAAPAANTRERPQHTRRATLLQQPAGEKADVAIEPIQDIHEIDTAWTGPPSASVARRAQSYSDFYDAVTAYSQKEDQARRKNSLDTIHAPVSHHDVELDFEAEYATIEELLLNESHAEHQAYLEELEVSYAHLDNLLASTTSTLGLLSTLSDSFKAVEAQTEAFRQQCEELVLEQRRLSGLAHAIDENVQYYAYLEPMTRRLNAPGAANLVKASDFLDMLSNLDNCLAYMESHPKHKESATYRSRYRLLLTRGLTLIRHYFTKSLGEIAADISKRIQGGQLKEATHSAILYAKFRVPAPEMKNLGLEIQKRAVPTPEDVDTGREPEYLSLLRELYQSYSTTRGRLILPLVAKKMADLAADPQQADVVSFAKSCLSFARGICLDEYDLWFEWFETEGALYDFLESLLEPMYDYLRPRAIHETKMEKLCDLCTMIQGRYMEVDSDEDDDVEDSVVTPSTNGRPLGRKLDFGNLIHPALEDAQTRLVFLALNVLRDSIENYKPKPEDLDFAPRAAANGSNGTKKGPILSGKRNPTTPSTPAPKTLAVAEDDIDDAESMFSKRFTPETTAPGQRQWYPTLRKAIWLLRRIYRLVNSTVFDDLAHRIVHSTIASLLYASNLISSQKDKSPQDGQLFLIVHLLHLKQQIVAFDIEFIPPEVEFDFSSVTNTFYELRDRGSLWNPASWVRLVSGAVVGGGLLPKVVENMLDAKAELDGRLRTVINDFVKSYASHITAPVDPATIAQQKKKKTDKQNEGDGGDSGFDGMKAIRTVRGLAEKDAPLLRAKLEEFVDDARTRETLVAAVRDQVLMSYEEFFDIHNEGQEGGRKLSRKGKGREDEIWGPPLFGEAMEKVFQVGRVVGDDDEDEDDRRFSD
ncbi:hypothetical protein CBER1_00263 [Cercospora berteroae]|uniref:Conserved oligomeric Golgi complex subunit 3 n=1 Tax=Cercospora berteroae TaxID=357750 RepID=A0A2S6CD39_9PEZI|nr:hypothetical protein CBER1_00263 [Cercospora berteroae]